MTNLLMKAKYMSGITQLHFMHMSICFYDLVSVSEWMLFSTNPAVFQLYHGENKLIFNEMKVRSGVHYTNTLSCSVLVLAHWSNSLRMDMSLHSDGLSWFRANQSCVPSGKTASNKFIVFWLTLEPIGTRTHHLSYSKRARRCSSF